MSSTFGIFTVARLGILAASQGLNVTGNNISNINTDNYVRQQLDQFSLHVGTSDRLQNANEAKAGNGVIAPAVVHNRDAYLDIRYRNACANVGEMESKVNGLDHLSNILDEVTKGEDGEGVLEGLYNEMITQLNSLAAEGAGKDQYDTLFRSSMSAFVHQLNKCATDLNSLEYTMSEAFDVDLEAANDLIDQIRALNSAIRKNQIYGDRSLEQQDQRDGLLDELSKYIKIDITYEKEQVSRGLEVDKLVIRTATEPRRLLCDGIYAGNLILRPNAGDDMGAVNAQGIPVDIDGDNGAITDGKGNINPENQALTYSSLEEAEEIAAALTEDNPRVYQYKAVTDENGTVTIHRYSASQALTFDTKEAADDWAEATSKEYAGIEFRTVQDEKNGTYTVHKFNLNYDLNMTELVDTHGMSKVVKELDLGTVKNEDKGPIIDEEGNTDETMPYLTFDLPSHAQSAAAALTENAMGLMEYRVVTDENGSLTIHAFATTVYNSKEEALENLKEMNLDTTSEHVNELGEVMKYYYQVVEQGEGTGKWVINAYDLYRGKTLLGDTEVGGKLLADRETLTEKGYFSSAEDLERDPDCAGKRGIPYYQRALDSLANHLANTLNAANQLPDETLFRTNEDGEFVDAEDNVVTERSQYVLRDEYKDYNGGILLSNHPNTNDETNITARNISISQNWDNGSFRVIRSTLPNAPSTASDNLNHIYTLLTDGHVFEPNNAVYKEAASSEIYFSGSYQELLTDHISASLASDTRTANTMLNNYTTDADELYVNRDGVIGVDLNDEAMMIMKYQKAYGAACRLMTAYDDMLERLVNGTAL